MPISFEPRKEGPGDNEVRFWLREIKLAEKREKEWRKDAKHIVGLYEAEKEETTPFNVLYSNTETLSPAVYNATPRPVVSRRYDDPDPVGLMASMAARRLLEFLLDNPDAEYESFNTLVQAAVLGALVPGRGVTRFSYVPKFDSTGPQAGYEASRAGYDTEPPTGLQAGDKAEPQAGGEAEPPEPSEETPEGEIVGAADGGEVVSECVHGRSVAYDEMLHGYAKRWEDVPWVAFAHEMTKADLKKNFGGKVAARVVLGAVGGEEPQAEGEEENKGSLQTALVWEIWHKEPRKVLFLSESYTEGLLKRVNDPLGLTGFFNCPRPLSFTLRNHKLIPVPLYKFYETQAKELNRLTVRISRVAEAIKVRGFYDGMLKDIGNLLEAPDNTLLPSMNVSALGDSPSLDKHIWLMPLEKLVTVLSQLMAERQQVKQVIYEITGISDILRGSSVASETATAQQLKNQWGTMRLRRMQAAVQEYVRECMRMMVEIAGAKFGEATFARITGMVDIVPTAEKQQAQAMLAQMQQRMALMPPPPEAQAQVQAQIAPLVEKAQATSWGEVLKILRDDFTRAYRIDIETNSTVDLESTEDQKNMQELLGSLSQLMAGMGPAVEKGALPLGAFKAIMLAVTRRFRFGPEIEKQLQAMPEQIPKEDKGEEVKLQVAQMQAQADMASLKLKGQIEQQKAQADIAKMKMEMELAQREHALKLEEAEMKMEAMRMKAQVDMMVAQQKARAAQETAVVTAATRSQGQGQGRGKGNGGARV